MSTTTDWKIKLHARLHDPAEKALVLLRDPAGHEGGTSRRLHQLYFDKDLDAQAKRHVQRADWWASAADRPQWPMDSTTYTDREGQLQSRPYAPWARVNWSDEPVLIHPLTGQSFDLGRPGGDFRSLDPADIKERSYEHFRSLIESVQGVADGDRDYLTALALWRFGPELRETDDNQRMGALWPLLPADTRVPDHTIWDHLDLTSAFAGAFAADQSEQGGDGEVALLAMAIGPVQPFIEAARSTSDLWAGSHLLARLSWELMRPICEALGPDAVLFPRLRGIPQIDLWLKAQGLPDELFQGCEWRSGQTDSNPLFSAALPNRFVAVVPRSQARSLAENARNQVHDWINNLGEEVVDELLLTAELSSDERQHCHEQMSRQLQGFPEVHWASVPFSLIQPRNRDRQTDLDTGDLKAAMAPFFGVAEDQPSGFLSSPAWQVLQKGVDWPDGTRFFQPNPGVLYPAIYELLERVLAAAKSTRPFTATEECGWRCSLTGETEWLTIDPKQLKHNYRQQQDTLWARIAERRPQWARRGEHLGALPAIKRLWPMLFAREVEDATEGKKRIQRFVVSTHTMALAVQLDRWMEDQAPVSADWDRAKSRIETTRVALPRRFVEHHRDNPHLNRARELLDMLEAVEAERAKDCAEQDEELINQLEGVTKDALKPYGGRETYYGLMLLDGDRMGQWLAGDPDAETQSSLGISFAESFHPKVREAVQQKASEVAHLADYLAQIRPVSPNRHLAISGALNNFSLSVVRHVLEREYNGRLLYAGGDDVMAMLPVAELMPAMERARLAYSGDPGRAAASRDDEQRHGNLKLNNGFAWCRGQLMRMMGVQASASSGAVVAHHQAPLGAVLRALRAAEQRAKRSGGDSFNLTVIKRAGGTLFLTAPWGEPIQALEGLRRFLADERVSRRAAYNCQSWLKDLPEPTDHDGGGLLSALLRQQFIQQSDGKVFNEHGGEALVQSLVKVAIDQAQKDVNEGENVRDWIENALSVVEFLARETRTSLALAEQGEAS